MDTSEAGVGIVVTLTFGINYQILLHRAQATAFLAEARDLGQVKPEFYFKPSLEKGQPIPHFS